MPHIRSSDAPTFQIPDLVVTGLASPSRGSTDNSVWRVVIPAGAPGVLHSMDREEIFVALSGRAVATLGGDLHRLEPGDALVVPKDQMFTLGNEGPDDFVAVAIAAAGVQAHMPSGDRFDPPWVK
jgi:mannose-6-phosphate isomerase-like protein (cupin superfamily)